MTKLQAVEICAGAGGQALGLERAGFDHALAVELDATAAETLTSNRSKWDVRVGDVADERVWEPAQFEGIDLLAGGVPCPPFSIAGRQLGADDERDLFAWAIELCAVVKPRALMLENVRGLSTARFSAYRQHVLDRLSDFGYVADWRLLQASDYGVPQLRPRFVLVAMRPADAAFFTWPDPVDEVPTVGEELVDLMGANGWRWADHWATRANRIAPTRVGGSKKHGGADLGPTRAKRAWAEMGVDGRGIADAAPAKSTPKSHAPKLTIEMVARLQGWQDDWGWKFAGRKTSRYRQIGNAFPPPVAEAVGGRIRAALEHEGDKRTVAPQVTHDAVYRTLRASSEPLTIERIIGMADEPLNHGEVLKRLKHLARDFTIHSEDTDGGPAYRLGEFRAFIGQDEHIRHEYLASQRSRVS